MTQSPSYTLDRSLALEHFDGGRWRGATSAAYANRVGPYGGWIAALLMKAILDQKPQGEPLSLDPARHAARVTRAVTRTAPARRAVGDLLTRRAKGAGEHAAGVHRREVYDRRDQAARAAGVNRSGRSAAAIGRAMW